MKTDLWFTCQNCTGVFESPTRIYSDNPAFPERADKMLRYYYCPCCKAVHLFHERTIVLDD